MSTARNEFGIKLSILDRIIGLDPRRPGSAVVRSERATIRDLQESLHRDLTALLNTRRSSEPISREFEEASASLLTFGLSDFTGCSALDRSEQERFRREIEEAIRRFEPRLSDVTVSLDRPRQKDRQARPVEATLHYHVRALLRLEPEPEPVYFDAVLEPGSGRVELQDVGARR